MVKDVGDCAVGVAGELCTMLNGHLEYTVDRLIEWRRGGEGCR
jgi:hypothetical protein